MSYKKNEIHPWTVIGMTLTMPIMLSVIVTGSNILLHLWAVLGMVTVLAYGVCSRKYIGKEPYNAEADITVAFSVIFVCYMCGPAFGCQFFYDNRMEFKSYARIANRGYIFPTKKNKEIHFLKRLNGELKE